MVAVALAAAALLPARALAQADPVPGPTASFESGPEDPTPTNNATPTFAFSSSDPLAGFECALDGASPAACESPYTTPVLGDGQHQFAVRALDVLSNPGDWATRTFTVDTAAPGVSIDSGPGDGSTTTDATPVFAFSSADAGATFACSVDGANATPCDSPYTSAALADGAHSFAVQAFDSAGNESTASRSFSVDTVAPSVSIDNGPANPTPTADATPTFWFSSDDPGASFECAVDSAVLSACDSPHTTASLSDGSHSFRVRATDAAGNSSAIVTRDFSVDSSVPAVTFTGGPSGPTRDRRPTFTFTSDTGTSFECRLDGVDVPCSSGSFTPAADLADGAHIFEARARSSAGAAGSYEPRGFSVDTTPPETVLIAAPPAQTTERSPRFEFQASEPAATFECRLDGGSFSPCSSPWTPPRLALGPHRLEVRALDAVGNADPSPALSEFTVADPPPPLVQPPLVQPPPPRDVDAGLRLLATDLVKNLDRVSRPIRTTEMRAILRRDGLTVRGATALMPGTLTLAAKTPARGATRTVLKGSTSFAGEGSAPLTLKPTRAGRAMMTRYASLPLLLTARFSTLGLSLAANREATLVRDYLTRTEARRAVARALAETGHTHVSKLAVAVLRRCGSNCLKVRARWLAAHRSWTATARARQVAGRLRARIAHTVSARR